MGFRQYLINEEIKTATIIIDKINELDKWAMQSWGAKNIQMLSDGIVFDARSENYTGKVNIIYVPKRDKYQIEIGGKIFRSVEKDQFVKVIDRCL